MRVWTLVADGEIYGNSVRDVVGVFSSLEAVEGERDRQLDEAWGWCQRHRFPWWCRGGDWPEWSDGQRRRHLGTAWEIQEFVVADLEAPS